jgi:hypothetical protein
MPAALGHAGLDYNVTGSICQRTTFVRTIHNLRAVLLGLFVLAQVAGVIPLIYEHTLNVFETVPVKAHGHPHVRPDIEHPDADHHHGALDLHDQCCALHNSLTGPLPNVIEAAPVGLMTMRVASYDLVALAGSDPPVPDRPPRPVPLN